MFSDRKLLHAGLIGRYLWLLLFVTLAIMPGCNSGEESSRSYRSAVAENKPAPELHLEALDGGRLTLSGLKGKVVLLNFWATWCPPCREEIPSMMRLNRSMSGKPFQMLAVSVDEGGREAVSAFFKKSGYSLPTYLDVQNRAASAYGVSGVPESYIIDRSGLVVKRVIGPRTWDAPDVIAYLESLMK